MKNLHLVASLLLILAVLLSACSEASLSPQTDMTKTDEPAMMDDQKSDEMMEEEKSDTMMEDDKSDSMMEETGSNDKHSADDMMEDKSDDMTGAMGDKPAWFSASLTDVNSNTTFRIEELKGKVILVETMAMWCSNCLKQQIQVKELHELLGSRDDFISIGVDIDPNENAGDLVNYTDKNSFDWSYVVATKEMINEFSSLYGDQFLNPPSTPMLIIDREGVAHPLPFGIKDAQTLLDALKPFLDESM